MITNVIDNVTPYLVVQECGNRTGVYWAKVMDDKGRGLCFKADEMELTLCHTHQWN